MSAHDNSGPAFPLVIEEVGCINQVNKGMTLRDWLAGQALVTCQDMDDANSAARWAYAIADAMLAARKGGAK